MTKRRLLTFLAHNYLVHVVRMLIVNTVIVIAFTVAATIRFVCFRCANVGNELLLLPFMWLWLLTLLPKFAYQTSSFKVRNISTSSSSCSLSTPAWPQPLGVSWQKWAAKDLNIVHLCHSRGEWNIFVFFWVRMLQDADHVRPSSCRRATCCERCSQLPLAACQMCFSAARQPELRHLTGAQTKSQTKPQHQLPSLSLSLTRILPLALALHDPSRSCGRSVDNDACLVSACRLIERCQFAFSVATTHKVRCATTATVAARLANTL